jgi:hypothetical protein
MFHKYNSTKSTGESATANSRGNAVSATNPDLIFVKEFCTFAKDYRVNPTGDIASIDVSTCHVLEIRNEGPLKQRTSLSITHFTGGQLHYPHLLAKSMDIVIENFKAHGGDMKTAQLRILGGSYDKAERDELRENLKVAINNICPDVKIKEQDGHWMSAGDQSIDYIFPRQGLQFRKMLDRKDESKDIFSKKLDSPLKKKVFGLRLDKAYRPISAALDGQTKLRSRESRAGNLEMYITTVVGADGLINSLAAPTRTGSKLNCK